MKRKRLLLFSVDETRCVERIITVNCYTTRFVLLFGNHISVDEIHLEDTNSIIIMYRRLEAIKLLAISKIPSFFFSCRRNVSLNLVNGKSELERASP